MADLVIKRWDKRRLKLLIAGKLTDKNIWINKEKNEWSLLLEEHNIRALAPAYNYIIVPYNKPRKNFTKDVGKRRRFYVV